MGSQILSSRLWLKHLLQLARASASNGDVPVFVDIGARDGLNEPWDMLARQHLVSAHGIEPAIEHCRELQIRDPHVTYHSIALDRETQEKVLYRTLMPGCSSLLSPNYELLDQFPARSIFSPTGTSTITVTRFDEFWPTTGARAPTFLKIDTQGSELPILEGLGKYLDSVMGIELEAQMKPMYVGQALLPEVKQWLDAKGFILRELRPNGPYEGELLEVDAFFSRRPALDSTLPLIGLWELCVELRSPSFLHDMTDWKPEWLTGITEREGRLKEARARMGLP